MNEPGARAHLQELREHVRALGLEVRRGQAQRLEPWRARVGETTYAHCAANLAAYLDLRQHDIRDLQDELALLGLSSLGRAEAHVRASIAAVESALGALLGDPTSLERIARISRLSHGQSHCLVGRTAALLGPEPAHSRTRIMVTLPTEAGTDPDVARNLVQHGMDIARINGAHDGPESWRSMSRLVREAAREAGRECRILLDLPGPKLRVAPLPGRPGSLRVRGAQAKKGEGRFLLDGSGAPGAINVAPGQLPGAAVDPAWLALLVAGDRIRLTDPRGRARTLVVESQAGEHTVVVSTEQGLLLTEGVELTLVRGKGEPETSPVGPFEQEPGRVRVHTGDALLLHARTTGPTPSEAGEMPWLACLHEGVLEALSVGDEVIFDDGHVVTSVESLEGESAVLRVTATRRAHEELRAEQGMNFPSSPVRSRGLSDEDIRALDVAVEVADIVGLSFAQGAEDLDQLHDALVSRGSPNVGVIAKIETHAGIEHLPEIIVAGAARGPFGVMIARGDLAVEIGYERLAEMQEELLWLCEAAHVPVVWATQVLESLVKTGVPTRAELTDAAMAQRAECVMLNKGPYLDEGLDMLIDVTTRMRTHQRKKTPRLRALHSW